MGSRQSIAWNHNKKEEQGESRCPGDRWRIFRKERKVARELRHPGSLSDCYDAKLHNGFRRQLQPPSPASGSHCGLGRVETQQLMLMEARVALDLGAAAD